MHTWRPLAAAMLAIAIAGVTGCSRPSSESKTAQSETQVLVNAVNVVQAETLRLESGVSFSGELAPSEVVQVNARFDGDLKDVLVREGQPVQRGQSLAVYEPRDIEDALQAAEADLLSAQAALLAAQNGERRAQRLLEAGGAAPSDLEAAQAQRTAAEARVSAAEAYRNHAKENAERLDVPSPITGWVSKTFCHGGDRTAIGDPIAQVVDTRVLELSATVPADALGRIQPGTTIRLRIDAFPGEIFSGSVDRVSPTTEPGTRQLRLFARIPNPDGRLVGGLFASGRVVDSARDQALAAPIAALRTEGTAQVVYRLQQGRARRVVVQTGLLDEEAGIIELLGEVSAGDSLLTGVLPGLRDGAPVRVLVAANGTSTMATSGAGR
jgi:membrane fusion protein (multidrug efflux system)